MSPCISNKPERGGVYFTYTSVWWCCKCLSEGGNTNSCHKTQGMHIICVSVVVGHPDTCLVAFLLPAATQYWRFPHHFMHRAGMLTTLALHDDLQFVVQENPGSLKPDIFDMSSGKYLSDCIPSWYLPMDGSDLRDHTNPCRAPPRDFLIQVWQFCSVKQDGDRSYHNDPCSGYFLIQLRLWCMLLSVYLMYYIYNQTSYVRRPVSSLCTSAFPKFTISNQNTSLKWMLAECHTLQACINILKVLRHSLVNPAGVVTGNMSGRLKLLKDGRSAKCETLSSVLLTNVQDQMWQ